LISAMSISKSPSPLDTLLGLERPFTLRLWVARLQQSESLVNGGFFVYSHRVEKRVISIVHLELIVRERYHFC
jgi:hypothetical protein